MTKHHASIVFGTCIALFAACGAEAAVTISTNATKNMSCVSGVCTPTAKNAVLNVTDLTNMLGTGNVTVNTGTGSLAQQVNDIVVLAGFTWASASSLTLDAYRSITFRQPVGVAGTGGVTLTTNDGGSDGNLSFIQSGSLSFFATANSLTIDSTSYTLVNTIASLASAVAANPSGAYAFSASYDASKDGTYAQSPVPTTFTGTFEGLGNTISNVTVSSSKPFVVVGGLFSEVDNGLLRNVILSDLNMTVTGKGVSAGGLVGKLDGRNDSTTGVLSADRTAGKISGNSELGGLVGANNGGTIMLSSSSASVKSKKSCAGGLVGGNDGTVTRSFATGNVSGLGAGLVCVNEDLINNSYAMGRASGGTSSTVGGLVGDNEAEIDSSYSTGSVSGGANSWVGGFVGFDDRNAISSSYWDTTTSGTEDGTGNEGNVQGLTGLTSSQLKSGLPAGFDPAIWAEKKGINNGFPYLIDNPPR